MCDRCGKSDDSDVGINTVNLCDSCYLEFLHGPEVGAKEERGDL